MAVPTFRSWVDTDILTAAQLNVDIRDNGKFILNPPQVYAYLTVAQSIPNATLTPMTFNGELYDRSSGTASTMHDLVTNNSRVTPNAAGIYLLKGDIEYAAQAVAAGFRYLYLRLNGVTYLKYDNKLTAVAGWNTVPVAMEVSYVYEFNGTTDYIELVAFHGAGAALNVTGSLSVTRIG
jgi:hypothetical protein